MLSFVCDCGCARVWVCGCVCARVCVRVCVDLAVFEMGGIQIEFSAEAPPESFGIASQPPGAAKVSQTRVDGIGLIVRL